MHEFQLTKLDQYMLNYEIVLGRGNIISREDIEKNPGNYPIYSSSAQGDGKFGEYNKYMFDEEMITWSVDGGGDFFYRTKHKFSVTNVSGFMKVDKKKLSPRFIYYCLANQHRSLTFDYTTKAHPSVIKNIYSVPVIDLWEQNKISEILTSIDCTIEKTEALISKYEQIKQGLMQDLFTRGIDENDQLRPPYEEAPHLYKETELGWVPKQWQAKNLETLLEDIPSAMRSGPFGSALLKSELVDDGYPLLGIDNIFRENFNTQYKRFVSQGKFDQLYRYRVRPRDVIITIMGTVGRCCVVPESLKEALSSKHLWTMTFDETKVLSELICWQLNYAPWVKHHFRKYQQGGVMDAIQSSVLKSVLLPLPPLKEQKEIRTKYLIINQKIDTEIGILAKLRMKKLGLMEDLLTGKVRVSLDKQAEEAATQTERQTPPAFKRAVLAAEIVHQLHENPRFGAVKQEKLIDLCERHLNLHDDLNRTSYRQAAGPYDNKAKRSIESNFKKQKWFDVQREKGKGVKYIPLEKYGQHKTYFDRYFGHCASDIQALIDLLQDAKTEQCEIVATLYAVWNDFLLDGNSPSDDEIVQDVLTNWHPDKTKIAEGRWLKALVWMRKKGLVPEGTGKHTEAVA